MEWLIAIVSEFLVTGLFGAVKAKASAARKEEVRRKLLALSRETLEDKVTRAASDALSDFQPALPRKLKAPVSAFFQQTLRGELPKLFRSGEAIDGASLQTDLERWLTAKAPDVDARAIAADLMPRVLSAFEFVVARDPVLKFLRLSKRLASLEALVTALPDRLSAQLVSTLPKAVARELLETLPGPIADEIERRQAERGQEDSAEAERRYIEFVKQRAATMTFTGMPIPPRSDIKPPRTDQMYVALKLAKPARVPYDEAAAQVEEPPGRRRAREGPPKERALERPVEIGEAMRRHRSVVILGKPGSGKSTMVKYVALAFARGAAKRRLGLDEKRLPVLIELRDFAARLPADDMMPISLTEFLAEQAERHDCSVPEDFFKRHRENGDCIVLLDGLDEVRDETDRQRVAASVRNFLRECGRNVRVVVTSRVTGYRPDFFAGSQFEEFEVQDFTVSEEVPEFVQKWYALVEKVVPDPSDRAATPQRLVDTIKKSPGIQRLATNPLLLTLIALIDRGGRGALPRKRVKLYERCSEALLSTWMRAKGLEPYVDEDEARERLEALALWMHRRPSREEAQYAEVVEQVAKGLVARERFEDLGEARRDAKDFLRDMQARAGLLVESGVGVWGFMHLTFQEYFAACALHRFGGSLVFEDTVEQVMKHVGDPAWEETVRLVCGLCTEEQVKALVGNMLDQEDDIFHSNLLLAAKCLGDAVTGETRLTKQVDDALQALYSRGDLSWAASRRVLEAMALAGRPSTVRSFIEGLGSDSMKARESAAAALAELRHPMALRALEAALKDTASGVSWEAAHALGCLNTPEAIQALTDGLGASEPEVKRAAAQALGALGSRSGSEAQRLLVRLLGNKDEDLNVRDRAAWALGFVGGAGTRQSLIETLRDGGVPNQIRQTVAFSLGNIGGTAASRALADTLKDRRETPYVRAGAAWALRQGQTREALRTLIRVLEDDNEHARVRCRAAWALGWTGNQEALPALLDALEAEDAEVREGGAFALLFLRSPKALDPLTRLLTDIDPQVRATAARAVGRIGHRASLPALVAGLRDEAWAVRDGAAEGLGELGEPAAVPPLIQGLKDPVWLVSHSAYDALGKICERSGQRIYPKDVPGWPELWERTKQAKGVRRKAAGKGKKSSVVSSEKKSTKAKKGKKG